MGRASEIAWAFLVGVAATVIVFFMFFHPRVLNPVEAYCRGSIDMVAYQNELTDEEYEAQEANCAINVRDGELLSDSMRGPLVPE